MGTPQNNCGKWVLLVEGNEESWVTKPPPFAQAYLSSMTTETKTQKLRALLSAEGCHDVLGCHDAMSAKLIEEAKFPVAYFSGFAFSASRCLPKRVVCDDQNSSTDNCCGGSQARHARYQPATARRGDPY
eukprot:2982649-Rhodomonas_salina.3